MVAAAARLHPEVGAAALAETHPAPVGAPRVALPALHREVELAHVRQQVVVEKILAATGLQLQVVAALPAWAGVMMQNQHVQKMPAA